MRSFDPFDTVILPLPAQLPMIWVNGLSAALDVAADKARRPAVIATVAKLRALNMREFIVAQTRDP
jgi:hypothetical protein